ncbi:hypothetical protein LQW54_004288 [Pestalotiopsis sp. IQ-011]
MPWTILPSIVILWGVCWMFYNASQASSPALGFEFEDHSGQFGGSFDPFHGLNFNHSDQDFGFFNNEIGPLDPMTSGSAIGVFDGSEMQIQAEPRQPIPGLQQQQAEMHSSELDHALAPRNLSELPAQTSQREQAQNPIIRCTESGCRSEFGTERELRRHRETVHDGSKFPCTVTGCRRDIQSPFNRLDNLQRHMRKAHGPSEQTPTAAPRNTAMRGQKRRTETSPQPVSSPESKRRRTQDAQEGGVLRLSPLLTGHSQDDVARLQEQLAEARRREDVHVARIKALEKEVEAHAEKLEALRKDNEVQDAYIKYLGRKV